MSYGTNPFAMGGWSNNGNPASTETPEHLVYANMPIPALQHAQSFHGYQATGARPSFSTYRFLHPSPPAVPGTPVNVLNSVVADQQNQAHFFITTTARERHGNQVLGGPQPASATTSITNAQGGGVALVEWFLHPVAQLMNVFPRQLISTILQIRTPTTIAMVIRGITYNWVRNPGDRQMYFYDASFNPPELLAIVTREETGAAMLNISPVASQQGLLGVVVLSSALLLSGRTLD